MGSHSAGLAGRWLGSIVLPLWLTFIGTVAAGSCQNPLFAIHWAGKSDIVHIPGVPRFATDLTFCPAYGNRSSCCTGAFEQRLKKAFDLWVAHFREKVERWQAFRNGMEVLQASVSYSTAPVEQKALFGKAVASFGAVDDTFGTCFDTLLEYMAGVFCFACDADWQNKVFLDAQGVSVVHLRVHESSHDDLWQSCQPLGEASQELLDRVADSPIAKQVRVPLEDLHMFTSRIAVAEYMAHNGLYAFRGPRQQAVSRKQLPSGEPVQQDVSVVDDAARPQRRLKNDHVLDYIYPVRDGRVSSFQCTVFPRQPLAIRSSAALALPWLSVEVVIALALVGRP